MPKNKGLQELDRQLEEAFRNRPVVYGFWTNAGRQLTVEEVTIIINNVAGYDRVQQFAIGYCAVPGCGYPLYEDTNFYANEVGYVCRLCHDMIDIVRQHASFLEWHRRWKQGFEKDKDDGTTKVN
jgi:hypothetical protein